MEKQKDKKAFVKIMLKDEVLDPQGKAVLSVLKSSGYTNIGDVRVGKYIELKIEPVDSESGSGGGNGKDGDLFKEIEEISHKVLSNPLIEDFSIEIK